MRRSIFFLMVIAASLLLNAHLSSAQRTFSSQSRSILKTDGQGACWQSSTLGLTEHQVKTLENLQHAFMAEAIPLRKKLISLRFELRYSIRDPNVQPKILLDRQKKISELQTKLDDLSLSYQIKARSIFTKEQLERLPPSFSIGMELGSRIETDPGTDPRRRLRK
jgi:hypothetical protein